MNFIIYTFSYNDDSGGTVVLHKLCHLLNEEGFDAKLWINYKPIFDISTPIRSTLKYLKYLKKSLRRPFFRNPKWNTPIATKEDISENTVIIYPEIVDGNPLNGKNIVRWLLHKPGYHNGIVNYGQNDLVFLYIKAYAENCKNIDLENMLYIPNNREDVYYQYNFGERKGSCYILRKGKNRHLVHDLNNSICIDGKTHIEISKIFNEVEYCISYDTYTMYSVYASLCGCKSIVVPEKDVDKNKWCPEETECLGIAYGFDDLESYERTRPQLIQRINNDNIQTIQQIHAFSSKAKKYFNI